MQRYWQRLMMAGAGCLLAGWVAQAEAQTCTKYAAPNGSGSSCTNEAPCKIKTFLTTSSLRLPGATLCLKNGTYTGEDSMIHIPESFAGTAEKPITIRAVEPGKVTIDGQDGIRPVDTKGSYGVISGINAARGDNQNVMVRGHHWLLRDIMTWNVGSNGDTNILMSGTDNTVEDCGSWGVARKSIAIGAAGGDRNTIRRCWTRWEGNLHMSSNPSVTIEGGYGQNTFTIENVIATWNRKDRVTEPEGIGEMFSTNGSKWLGSIFYLVPGDDYAPSVVFAAYTDAGSQSQQGIFNPVSNLLFKHNLAFVDPGHAKFGSLKGFYFAEGTDGGPPGTNNVVANLTSVSGVQSTFSSRSFPTSNTQWGKTISEAIGAGKSMWTDSLAGPGICKRYVNGVLTDKGLWPFPSDKRISDALVQSGYPAMSITATMESLFGPIPEMCKSVGPGPDPGPGPGPGPSPAVPVPPTNVTAVAQGAQVLVSWDDTVNTTQTGYTIERKIGTGEFAMLTDALDSTARSYVDAGPVVGSRNCYVVYTRGTAGPSGFSAEACLDVSSTVPPNPMSGPLEVTMTLGVTCTGTYELGTPVRMVLTCTAP